MDGRRIVRGARRPVVLDLLLSVAVASLLMAGARSMISCNLNGLERLGALLALLGVPAIAVLYGAASAVEMRRGWLGTSTLTGVLHGLLVLGCVTGIGLLAILTPSAAGMALASVSILLLWSASWA